MLALVDAALSNRWQTLPADEVLKTPDARVGSRFTVTAISSAAISIETDGGTPIVLHREAFAEVLWYLLDHGHYVGNPCPIGSDKDIEAAGPLCVAARQANGGNVMVIPYILPILARMGLVEIDGNRPNTSWLR